jgi:hypothetical protein
MMTSLICVTKMKTLFQVMKTLTSSHSQLYEREEIDINALLDSITDALMTMYQ